MTTAAFWCPCESVDVGYLYNESHVAFLLPVSGGLRADVESWIVPAQQELDEGGLRRTHGNRRRRQQHRSAVGTLPHSSRALFLRAAARQCHHLLSGSTAIQLLFFRRQQHGKQLDFQCKLAPLDNYRGHVGQKQTTAVTHTCWLHRRPQHCSSRNNCPGVALLPQLPTPTHLAGRVLPQQQHRRLRLKVTLVQQRGEEGAKLELVLERPNLQDTRQQQWWWGIEKSTHNACSGMLPAKYGCLQPIGQEGEGTLRK